MLVSSKLIFALLLSFCSLQISAQMANEGVSEALMANLKEGKSFHIGWWQRRYIKKIGKKLEAPLRRALYRDVFAEDINLNRFCAINLTSKVSNGLKTLGIKPKTRYLKGLLYDARKENFIDDFELNHLVKLLKASQYRPSPYQGMIGLGQLNSRHTSISFLTRSKEEKILQAYKNLLSGLEKGQCITLLWQSFIGHLGAAKIKVNVQRIREYNLFAFEQRIISLKLFQKLEGLNTYKIHEFKLGLREYLLKKKRMRELFPINMENPRSDVVTQKFRKLKVSWREALYQEFSPLQMLQIKDLVQKLNTRIMSFKVTINLVDKEGNTYVDRLLTPLEQYRYALKMIQIEMKELSGTTIFKGKNIDFLHVISAAFETNLASAEELQALAEIDLIWHPKKSLKVKLADFVNRWGPLATVLVPPGYNILVTLGLVVVRAVTVGLNQKGGTNDFGLF